MHGKLLRCSFIIWIFLRHGLGLWSNQQQGEGLFVCFNYLGIMLTRFLKCMWLNKCNYVVSFWKVSCILSLFEWTVYPKWNQLTKWYLQNTVYKPLFCLYIDLYAYLRGVHFVCVQKECGQYDGFPGSQGAQIEGQDRGCVPLWCCFWSGAWAGSRRVGFLAAFFSLCSRPGETEEKESY